MRVRQTLMAVIVTALWSPLAFGYPMHPSAKRGFDAERVYQVGDIDSVNLFSGNLIVRIPIGPPLAVSERLSYGLTLVYNSKAWQYTLLEETPTPPNPGDRYYTQIAPDPLSNAGVGWRLTLGELLGPQDSRTDPSAAANHANWIYVAPDGSDHVLWAPRDSGGLPIGNCDSEASPCYSSDGSYLRLRLVVVGGGAKRVVETPEGTRHIFESYFEQVGGQPEQRWRLTGIASSFASLATPEVEVIYGCAGDDSACPLSAQTWTIRDHINLRDTTVAFRADPSGRYPSLVDHATVPAFGGGTATYSFSYSSRALAPMCAAHNPKFSGSSPTLDLLALPHGAYGMTYDPGYGIVGALCGPGNARGGLMTSLSLPTGGGIAWDYGRRPMPIPACEVDIWEADSPAVGVRFLRDRGGATLGTWTYIHQLSDSIGQIPYGQPDECVGLHGGGGAGPSEQLKVTVTDPGGNKTDNYFSAFPGIPFGAGQVSQFKASEYGYPFTRAVPEPAGFRSDGPNKPRFLSTVVFDAQRPGEAARTSYVRYARDSDCIGMFPWCLADNQRLESSRVVYDDALVQNAPATVSTTYDDFDGVGHYRLARTFANFPIQKGANGSLIEYLVREEATSWNEGRTGRPGLTEPWLLNTFTRRQQRDGSRTLQQEYQFDPATGFLLCERWLRSLWADGDPARVARDRFDVGVAYTPDQRGNLQQERWYGGDAQEISTGGVCPSGAPAFSYSHAYAGGVRRETSASVGGQTLKLLDLTIDGSGLVSQSRDAAGLITGYAHDAMGRLTSIRPPGAGAAESTAVYRLPPAAAQAAVEIEVKAGAALLEKESFYADGFGRVTRREVSLPQSIGYQTTSYNGLGQASAVSEITGTPLTNLLADESTARTKYENYDAFGRVRLITQPGSVPANREHLQTKIEYTGDRVVKRTRYVWDGGANRPVTTREEYDALGRLVEVQEPAPQKTRTKYQYDVAGHLVQVTQNRNAANPQRRYFEYDGRGFLVSETHPESGMTQYLYDALGNVIRKTTDERTLLSSYDGAGRLQSVQMPTGPSQAPVLKEFAYGSTAGPGLGKLATSTRHNFQLVGSQCKDLAVTNSFVYGTDGRVAQKDTSVLGDGTSLSFRQSYVYDPAGRVQEIQHPCRSGCPAGEPLTTRTTYSFGRPTQIGTASSAGAYAESILYHPNGTLKSLGHPNGVVYTQGMDPDSMQRPRSIDAARNGVALWEAETYRYDYSGNIKSIGNNSYGYDSNSRLVRANQPGAGSNSLQQYCYDAYGNLTKVFSGTASTRFDCTAAGGRDIPVSSTTNRLQYGSYNAAGSLTGYVATPLSLEWDPFEELKRMTSGSEEWFHNYDAEGERVWSWRSQPTRVDHFSLRGLDGKLLREYTKTGETYAWESYVYREGQHLASVFSSGEVRHFDVDHLGSVRLVTAGVGGAKLALHEYWPYGEQYTAVANTEQMRFTGHERDLLAVTGTNSEQDDFDYMHARYYRPFWGRFASVDPLLQPGRAAHSPQLWNRYSYGLGNPLKFIDPTGMELKGTADKGCSGWAVYCFFYDAIHAFLDKVAPPKKADENDSNKQALLDPDVGGNPSILAANQQRLVQEGLNDATAIGAAGAAAATLVIGTNLPPGTKILQSAGNKITARTVRELNRFANMNLTRREWGRAVEALKKAEGLPNLHHGKITSTGGYLDDAGKLIGNLLDYLP